MKKISGYYPIWRIPELERLMDERAAQGEALVKLGQFSCSFVQDERAVGCIHRIGASESRKGSAAELEYCLIWQKKGWERFHSAGKLLFFRAPVGTAAPEDEGLPALLKAQIRWRELLRNWMLLFAALCMIVGYAMEGFTVVRLAALPLIVALVLSWEVSKLQKTLGGRSQ